MLKREFNDSDGAPAGALRESQVSPIAIECAEALARVSETDTLKDIS